MSEENSARSTQNKRVRVTQIASGNGRKPGQQATLIALGSEQDQQEPGNRGYPRNPRHGEEDRTSGEGRRAELTLGFKGIVI